MAPFLTFVFRYVFGNNRRTNFLTLWVRGFLPTLLLIVFTSDLDGFFHMFYAHKVVRVHRPVLLPLLWIPILALHAPAVDRIGILSTQCGRVHLLFLCARSPPPGERANIRHAPPQSLALTCFRGVCPRIAVGYRALPQLCWVRENRLTMRLQILERGFFFGASLDKSRRITYPRRKRCFCFGGILRVGLTGREGCFYHLPVFPPLFCHPGGFLCIVIGAMSFPASVEGMLDPPLFPLPGAGCLLC